MTMDDLYGRFLPQFVALARSRVEMAIAAATRRDHGAITTVVRELHSLAGEAGLLGLSGVIPLARECEHKAKLLHISRADADADALVAALGQLSLVVEGI